MIFHSTNNLKIKEKEKRKKKKEKRKKEKEGNKRIAIKTPCDNSNLVHTFQAWPSSF